jgi:hypothetical protein
LIKFSNINASSKSYLCEELFASKLIEMTSISGDNLYCTVNINVFMLLFLNDFYFYIWTVVMQTSEIHYVAQLSINHDCLNIDDQLVT